MACVHGNCVTKQPVVYRPVRMWSLALFDICKNFENYFLLLLCWVFGYACSDMTIYTYICVMYPLCYYVRTKYDCCNIWINKLYIIIYNSCCHVCDFSMINKQNGTHGIYLWHKYIYGSTESLVILRTKQSGTPFPKICINFNLSMDK